MGKKNKSKNKFRKRKKAKNFDPNQKRDKNGRWTVDSSRKLREEERADNKRLLMSRLSSGKKVTSSEFNKFMLAINSYSDIINDDILEKIARDVSSFSIDSKPIDNNELVAGAVATHTDSIGGLIKMELMVRTGISRLAGGIGSVTAHEFTHLIDDGSLRIFSNKEEWKNIYKKEIKGKTGKRADFSESEGFAEFGTLWYIGESKNKLVSESIRNRYPDAYDFFDRNIGM